MTVRRRGFVSSLLIAVLAAIAALVTAPTSAVAANSAYVMGYFVETPSGKGSSYNLHMAVSQDGLHWAPLNQNAPVARPTAGTRGLRDPFFVRKPDGSWVVLATDLNGNNFSQQNQYIHVWDSPDLRSFTGYRRVKMHSLPTHTWAPEAFYDASRRQFGVFYSAFNGTRDVILVNYTSDFRTVSAPQLYFDPGYNVLDATMARNGSTNYLYYKRNSDSTIFGARSSSLAPRSFERGIYTGPISRSTEAPIVVKSLTSNTWYLWDDKYDKTFNLSQTNDLNAGRWSTVGRGAYNQPIGSKHATIQPISASEYSNLVSRWGLPSWNRIRPSNFPTYYVRHQDYVGRIGTYPVDPFQDSQWRLRPGLSNSSGVSFESVNFPGRYLRHYNYALRLDPNDNSAAFRADATFFRVAGLANGGLTSFRSANFPDRYLRHYDYGLRIDPIRTTTDRQDATFLVEY